LVGMIGLSACGTAQATESSSSGEELGMLATPLLDSSQDETVSIHIQWATEFPRTSGTIMDISDSFSVGGYDSFTVLVEDADEAAEFPKILFAVNNNTVMLAEELEVGMDITVVHDISQGMNLIVDDQLLADSLVIGGSGLTVERFVKSDMFEREDARGSFFSEEAGLVVHISDETEIVFQDGSSFEGDVSVLDGRIFAFVSQAVALSYPGQTVPDKIVVLFERAEHPMLQLSPEDLAIMWDNMLNEDVQVIIDGEVFEMPAPFVNREAGSVMVPAAYIAEALGYVVYGEGEEVVIGHGTTFTVGVDSYFFARMAPIELGAAPELHDDVIFVPLHFFGMIFPEFGYILDGNVHIYSEPVIFDEWIPEEMDWSVFSVIIDNAVGLDLELYTAEGEEFPTHVPMVPVLQLFWGALDYMEVLESDPGRVSLNGWNGSISFEVGSTMASEEFTVADETVTLPHGAISIDGEIYVPILFFSEVFGLGSAYWTCGHVHIHSEVIEDGMY